MKLAVTDANIFIDLYELQLTESFFLFDVEIHTTVYVINELFFEQKEVLKKYQSIKKLTVHNLLASDLKAILKEGYPNSLSPADKSVLPIANKLNASVLSSDKAVRNYAKNKEIEYHGMIWIFDMLVRNNILSLKTACVKLEQLVKENSIYQNNEKLMIEVNRRLREWSRSDF